MPPSPHTPCHQLLTPRCAGDHPQRRPNPSTAKLLARRHCSEQCLDHIYPNHLSHHQIAQDADSSSEWRQKEQDQGHLPYDTLPHVGLCETPHASETLAHTNPCSQQSWRNVNPTDVTIWQHAATAISRQSCAHRNFQQPSCLRSMACAGCCARKGRHAIKLVHSLGASTTGHPVLQRTACLSCAHVPRDGNRNALWRGPPLRPCSAPQQRPHQCKRRKAPAASVPAMA